MEAYKDRARELALQFQAFSIDKILREEDEEADALACQASAAEEANLVREISQEVIDRPNVEAYKDDLVREIPVEVIDQPSID